MSIRSRLFSLWRNLFHKNQREQELTEEMDAYLEMIIESNIQGGLNPTEARRAALIEIGGIEQVKEQVREIRMGYLLETIWQDLRYGARMLRRQPGFTLIAVLSLTLGIGANTAIFSLIDATLWRLLPVKDPQQLILFSTKEQGNIDYNFSYPSFEQLRDDQKVFSGLIATSSASRMRLQAEDAGGMIETVQPERVSGNYFSVLGVNAALGRLLNEDDDRAANPQAVVVLSYGFWQRRFALDPAVVGQKIMLDDYPFTVVGIAPPDFTGLEVGRRPDMWWPVQASVLMTPGQSAFKDRGYTWLKVMGRLQPGTSPEQARAEMDVLFKQHMADVVAKQPSLSPEQRRSIESKRLELETGSTGWTTLRQRFKNPLLVLMAVVALVLLIACANIANLLLARATTRRQEIAMRLALGASRGRLLRQLLTESLLLAVLGGTAGVVFAQWGTSVLLTYLPRQNPVTLTLHPDARVLGFTLAVSLLTGLLFGLVPALQATRIELTSSLKDSAGAGAPRAFGLRLSLHKVLVVAQVALSLFLLIGAGLFVRSLQNLKTIDLGFERENLTEFRLETGKGYNVVQRASLYKQMLAKLESLPGVRVASLSTFSLLSDNRTRSKVSVNGFVAQSDDDASCNTLIVGPNYFAAMGIPLLSGREFGAQDERMIDPNAGVSPPAIQAGLAPLVAVINQAMAQHFFGTEDPIGKRFSYTNGPQPNAPIEIIGVVKDAKYRYMREGAPRTFYLAWFQQPGNSNQTFQLRTTAATNLATTIQHIAQELDPRLQIVDLRTMNERVDELLVQERFVAQLAGFFSLFALLLACLGLYGIMTQTVLRRTHEIGVRMALGAQSGDVLKLVIGHGLKLVFPGLLFGLAGSVALTRTIENLLYGVSATDPTTFAAIALLLTLVAMLACWIPARRATKVDPMIALRHE
jgi:predicted permease